MPQPAYIICASSVVTDEVTKFVSLFNVIEAFIVATSDDPNVAAIPLPPGAGPSAFKVVAAWIREDGDSPNVPFECQIALVSPEGRDVFFSQPTPFNFVTNFFRLTTSEIRLPGFPSLGLFRMEGRVRRVGETEWLARQSFPLLVLDRLRC